MNLLLSDTANILYQNKLKVNLCNQYSADNQTDKRCYADFSQPGAQ